MMFRRIYQQNGKHKKEVMIQSDPRDDHGTATNKRGTKATLLRLCHKRNIFHILLFFNCIQLMFMIFESHSFGVVTTLGGVSERDYSLTLNISENATKIEEGGSNKDNDYDSGSDNNDFMKTSGGTKPKLLMHIGPMKTGTTSLQGAIKNPVTYRRLLQEKDNHQVLVGPDDKVMLNNFFEYCLFREMTNVCNNYVNFFHREVDSFINATINVTKTDQLNRITMLHTNEDWSKIPRTDFALKVMKALLSKYDVHFIIYYRPFIDWLPSMHKQFKKFTLLTRGSYKFDEKYAPPFSKGGWSLKSTVPSFPEYVDTTRKFMKRREESGAKIEKLWQQDVFYDIMYVNEVLRDLLSLINKGSNPDENIHIMQAYTSKDTNTKIELFCNLLGAKESCKHAKTDKENDVELNRSDFYSKFLDLDILVREARKQGLIHIPRHKAAELLQSRMEESEDLGLSDLPMHCPSKEQEEWIWNRTVISEVMFGKTRGAIIDSQDSERKIILENLRGQFEDALRKKKFCSMDAIQALENAKIKALFHNCSFHSANKIDDDLKELVDVNPLWEELNCKI